MKKQSAEEKSEMYSRRVTKSEEDFLAEFEAELEMDGFDDFLNDIDENADFDEITNVKEEQKLVEPEKIEETREIEEIEENPMALFGMVGSAEPEVDKEESSAMESFQLGGVDLGALLSEASNSSTEMNTTELSDSIDVFSAFGDMEQEDVVLSEPPEEDVFASLFGDNSTDEPFDLENMFADNSNSSEGIDLGNLGEADLMSLLAGDGGLSDLGDMLSQGASSDNPLDGFDAFAAFAENEMASNDEPQEEDGSKKKSGKKEKKKGKGGFFSKIIEFLLSDDDDDEVELKKAQSAGVDVLSLENADILAQLDAEEKGDKKGRGGLFGKKKKDKKGKGEEGDKKAKKEKKPKKEKPKKEKPKKEKKPKEKKPKEVDNTPPLPKGPVILIWIMAISMFVLVFIGTDLVGYSTAVSDAKSLYNTGNYAEAYSKLAGITLKEKDMEIYNQVATLATVDSELEAYSVFFVQEAHEKALDSLVCAAGRCELNEDNADVYGCLGQMEILKKEVDNHLSKYGMTYDQAVELYHIKDREDYTIALYTKLKELGLY